jgi:hypothetical protein
MRTDLDQPGCRRSIGTWVAEVLRALRPTRPGRRCEDRSGWPDDEGLAGTAVPRRPRDPLRGGSIALELPFPDDG